MSFPDFTRKGTFRLNNVEDATIACRRAASQTEHAFTQSQEDTLISDMPTYSSIFLNTPTDPFCGEMTFDELSFQLNMQHHQQNMEDADALPDHEDIDASSEHQAPNEQYDQSTDSQEMAGSGHTMQTIVAAGSQSSATSSTPTLPCSGTTVRLTVRGNNTSVFLASVQTVRTLRDLLKRPQDDLRPHRVRANIASEVLKGNLSQDDLDSIRAQLDRDTYMLANAMSQRGADYR